MKTNFVVLLLLCSVYAQVNAQDWKLVYHNDQEGNAVEGKIEDLKDAIQRGAELRIAWGFQDQKQEKISVQHVTDAAFLTIQSDSIVFAQIRPIIGQTPDFENYVITLKENLEWVFIGGSNGKMDTMMRNIITGEIVSHNLKKSSFKWFVK